MPRYAGKVCRLHPALMGERYTNPCTCTECVNEASKRYQAKNREFVCEQQKNYRAKNVETRRAGHKIWRSANPERDAARKVQYRNKNVEKVKAAYKQYYEANYPRMLAKRNKQHADKIQRTPQWLTDDDFWMIEQAYELAALRTKMFGFAWHVDHALPLRGKKVSGLHTPYNLQVIPAVENLRKGNRMELA